MRPMAVYIFLSLFCGYGGEGVKPTLWDIAGGLVALVGMAIIIFGPKNV